MLIQGPYQNVKILSKCNNSYIKKVVPHVKNGKITSF
jgi:hypothetical protein